MTDADGAGTPTERAVAAVRALLDKPLEKVTNAGYTVIVPARDIVTAVQRELGDAALLLPRYYERDEGQAWLLGTARHVDTETGEAPNVYVTWRTGLPNGRMLVRIIEAVSPAKATELAAAADAEDAGEVFDEVAGATLLVGFTAAADSLPHALRALLGACEHSAKAPAAGGAR